LFIVEVAVEFGALKLLLTSDTAEGNYIKIPCYKAQDIVVYDLLFACSNTWSMFL